MSDDNDLNNLNVSKSFSKKDSKRNTRSSFQDVANDILNSDSQVKEGKIPTNTQQSKRRTIVGIKPEGLSNSQVINRKTKKSIVEDNPLMDNFDEEKKDNSKLAEQYKQDVLTRQAIDEIKDNIDIFKMDISKYINDLRNEQEKIELGEIKSEIKILQEGLEKDLKTTRVQNDKDFAAIKSAFYQFRDEVFQLIDKIVKEINHYFDQGYQYVFWYDPDGEFADDVTEDNQYLKDKSMSKNF